MAARTRVRRRPPPAGPPSPPPAGGRSAPPARRERCPAPRSPSAPRPRSSRTRRARGHRSRPARRRAPRRRTGCPRRAQRAPRGSPPAARPRRARSSILLVAASASGSSQIVVEFRRPPPQPGRRDRNSGRAVAMWTTGALASPWLRSRSSSRSSSALCRSSSRITAGRSLASSSASAITASCSCSRASSGCIGAGRIEAEREGETVTARQLAPDLRLVGALEDPEVLLDDLADRPVGDSVAVRQAAARAPKRRGLLAREQLPQLAHERRLPDPRLADERHQVRLVLRDRAPVGGEEQLELRLATDEHALESRSSPRSRKRQRPQHGPRLEPIGLSLRVEHPPLSELERAADRGDGALAGEDLARLGGLLEPVADVHRVSRDEAAAGAGSSRRRHRRCSRRSASRAHHRTRCRASVASRARRGAPAPRGPRARHGAPNTAITASPANFSTVPPVRSISSDIAS